MRASVYGNGSEKKMKKRIQLILLLVCMCIGMNACGTKQEARKETSETVLSNKKEGNSGKKGKLKEILEKGKNDAEYIDFQGYMATFQTLTIFNTPEILFTSKEQMEVFLYNTSLLSNVKYENVESGFLDNGRLSREKAEEVFQIIGQMTEGAQKLTEDVYLGKHVYDEDADEEFLTKYNDFNEKCNEWTAQINDYNSGYYGTGEETLQLGEAERGTYVVSTYKKIDSLDTGLKWRKVEGVDYDSLDTPKLNDSDMIYADYYEKFRKIASNPYGNNGRDSHGFEFMPELRVGYDTNPDDTLIDGTPCMILEAGDLWNQVDVQDMLYYFNSDEELANYYLDAMVRGMQVFYSEFGITDEMRGIISNVIKESLHTQSSTEGYIFVSDNNKYVIKIHAGQILFES